MVKFKHFVNSKKRLFTLKNIVWLLIPVCLSPISLVHAYLDAGNGSYIIQVAIGVIFGATYTIRTYSGRIIQYIKDRRRRKRKTESE